MFWLIDIKVERNKNKKKLKLWNKIAAMYFGKKWDSVQIVSESHIKKDLDEEAQHQGMVNQSMTFW